jgi:transposase
MSQSCALVPLPSTTAIIVGVDTHKYVHVAVAIDRLGTRLASCSVSADRAGYAELVTWAKALGSIEAFGIEGTGSYGVGLASYVRRHAFRVLEVSHCDRRKRRSHGKSDTLDAETAARSVLAGLATAIPKSADGAAEMVRQIKVARDTAVKAKSAAIITLKTLIVNAPSELREALEPLTDRKLIDRCARLLPGTIADTMASTKHALRALATRWLALSTEIQAHDAALEPITTAAAPTLREAFGIGADSAFLCGIGGKTVLIAWPAAR